MVGAGVFGVSSALAAKKRHAEKSVTLIQWKPTLEPASYDTAKIVRRVYNVKAYEELASQAMTKWEETEYDDVYHNSGWLVFHQSRPKSVTQGSRELKKEEAREIHGGILANTRLSDIEVILEDKATAWAEASKAVEKSIKTAETLGVQVFEAIVESLLWEGKTCVGVKMGNGGSLKGTVVLAMGCWTPNFLTSQSIPGDLGESLMAGVSVLGVKLSDEQYQRYKGMPVLAVRDEGTDISQTLFACHLLIIQGKSCLQMRIKSSKSTTRDLSGLMMKTS